MGNGHQIRLWPSDIEWPLCSIDSGQAAWRQSVYLFSEVRFLSEICRRSRRTEGWNWIRMILVESWAA